MLLAKSRRSEIRLEIRDLLFQIVGLRGAGSPTVIYDECKTAIMQLFENIFENYCIFNNYRPVLVLSSASKIFEKCIFNQLMSYLTDEDMTSSKQYGFRSS